MPACSRCCDNLPKERFTAKQLKAAASKRFCMACTQGAGTLHQFLAPAAPGPAAAERPSQIVHERTRPSPGGKGIVVQTERLSTGGTCHAAEFHPAHSARMDGTERMAKLRARLSLFPEEQAESRAKDAVRTAAKRAAGHVKQPVEDLPTQAWRKRQLQRFHFLRTFAPDADARWAEVIELHVHRTFWADKPTAFWQGHKLISRPGWIDPKWGPCPC